MPRVGHVIFDLDGTLVDSFPGIEHSARIALSVVRPGLPAPDFRSHVGPPIREIFRRALAETDPVILDALEKEFRRSYNTEGWKRSALYPGAAAVLDDLAAADCACYLLTNKPRAPTESILSQLGLRSRFREVITPDWRNPPYASKAEAALEARRRHGLDPLRTLLVGDSLDDAEAAESCGFRFAAAVFGYGTAATQTRHPIHARIHALGSLMLLVRPQFR